MLTFTNKSGDSSALAVPLNYAPGNPLGTSLATYRMMGLGSVLVYTPLKTGIIRVTISGKNLGTQANLEINIKVAYGIGAAPANGTAASGTVIGAAYSNGLIATAAGCTSTFFKTAFTPIVPINTQHWFDLQICRGSVSGTVMVQNLEVTFQEISRQ